MSRLADVHPLLVEALQKHLAAKSEAEVEVAMLAMHTAMQKAFFAYLDQQGYKVVDERLISFPDLLDLVRDHTDLFAGKPQLPRLLNSLNTTRNTIAHPEQDKPSAAEIRGDAAKFARFIRDFWPKWFGVACPVASTPPQPKRSPPPREPPRQEIRREPPRSRPEEQREIRTPPPSRPQPTPSTHSLLRRIWDDPAQPKLRWGRLIVRLVGIVILLLLSNACTEGALFTVRWPQPVKTIGLVLMLVAGGFLVWGIFCLGKVLWQLRLKRLLILVAVVWVLAIAASVLTGETETSFPRQVWLGVKGTIVWTGRSAVTLPVSIVETISEFQFAYKGSRQPKLLPGMDPEDKTYLTPIPANEPAAQAASAGPSPTPTPTRPASSVPEGAATPTPTAEDSTDTTPPPPQATPSLQLPDCPHEQARLTVPRVDEVIDDEILVKGSANIERLDYYKFEFRCEDFEDEWHYTAHFQEPVENGPLGVWQTAHLPDGTYTFRLTVVNKEGNFPYPPCDVQVQIKH